MSFPKKREDVEKVVEEVESRHRHEEHHHHHHHEGFEEIVANLELLVESLNARLSSLESRVSSQGLEVARLYKVLSHLVEALMASSEEEKREALIKALKTLETRG